MKSLKNAAMILGCISLVGCMPHFKEVDSYNSNFEDSYSHPEGMKPLPEAGDPYTFGGIAEGSGGLMARQSYATDNQAPDFRDATATGQMGEISKDRTPTPDQTNGTLPPGPDRAKPISNGGADMTGVGLRNPSTGNSTEAQSGAPTGR